MGVDSPKEANKLMNPIIIQKALPFHRLKKSPNGKNIMLISPQ
jgi:hypothetical protein